MTEAPPARLSVAPMMDHTDRHFRVLMRRLTRRALLYTEMVTTSAILHGDRHKLLDFDPQERPVALQLGGDDPAALAECARIAQDWGYDEVNLNVGCPSSRVRQGCFGAALMARPERVAEAVAAMRAACALPVTVKHRIGIDDLDRYEDMARFVAIVSEAGARRFTVHARKAWLNGLSPKDNRTIPPLRYGDVYRLARERPDLYIELNGGVRTLDAAVEHLDHVHAVMIGRAAYETPYVLVDADRVVFGDPGAPRPSRHEVVEAMLPYVEEQLARGQRLHSISRHMLTLWVGCPGTRLWKQHLSQQACRPGAGTEVLRAALALVPRHDHGGVEPAWGEDSGRHRHHQSPV